jgi:hypothetical protein
MRKEAMVALSALADGEEVRDLTVLAEALEAAERREALLEFIRLRSELPAPKAAPGHPRKSAADIEADQRVLAALRERPVSLILTARPLD